MGKLMIAIPTLDYVHRKFVESLSNLCLRMNSDGITAETVFEGCTLVYISRDNLVQKAIEGGYDEVLWLDADMVFEPDIYGKLKKHNKDLVSGVCRGRHGKNLPSLFRKLEPPDRWTTFEGKNGLTAIEGCGFACVLTKTTLLDRVLGEYGTCFRPTPFHGEDLAFCKRAKDLGYSMWADCDVEVGHIAQTIIYPTKESEIV